MKRLLLPVVAAGLFAFNGCNSADTTATTSQSGATPPTETAATPTNTDTAMAPKPEVAALPPVTDAEFIKKVDEGGHNEMGLSKVVLTKNPSASVKAYANKMIADHTKAGNELMPIAKKHAVALKGMMDAEHQTLRTAMLKMPAGAALEKQYIDQMVADHDKTVALFKSEVANGKEADVKAFASKTLPTIQQHDDMAKANDKMKM